MICPENESELQEAMRGPEPRRIIGCASAQAWLPAATGELLSTAKLNRILDYRPDDLMISAEAGVLLRDLQSWAAQDGLCIPLPPVESGWAGYAGSTIAGMVALGLPHAWQAETGSVRDWVCGAVAVNTRGERIESGARVAKSVAGFDFHRTLAGSRGSLMAIAVLHLKLFPIGLLPSSVPKPVPDPCWIHLLPARQIRYETHAPDKGFAIGPGGRSRGSADPTADSIRRRLKDLCDPAGVLNEGWLPREPSS